MSATLGRGISVLMICPQYRPIVGGFERAAERLSVALGARGHSVTVVTERRSVAWLAREFINGVTVRRLWCAYRPHFHIVTALASFALFLLTKGRRFDIWHVHQYGPHAALAIALGAILHRPVVLKLTNSAEQGLAQSVATGRFASVIAAQLKRAAAIVALTRETELEAKVFGIPAVRIHILGNGVDTSIFRPPDERGRSTGTLALRIGCDGIVIYVGRLSHEKNPDGLIQAWIKALPQLPAKWKLVLVGDGPMRGSLESMARKGCPDGSVLFAGQQDNIEEWMSLADIYVSSSRNEGLANTLLEAMASGLPVVATRVSGVTELVDESGAGLVAEIGDMDGLAIALVRLAHDQPLRKRMGEAGRKVIDPYYSIESVAERHENLYRRLLVEEIA
jgi:glycosyltransferase involved in cell wall biosynthesis